MLFSQHCLYCGAGLSLLHQLHGKNPIWHPCGSMWDQAEKCHITSSNHGSKQHNDTQRNEFQIIFFSPRCGESIHIKHHFFSLQLAAVMGFQQYVYFKSPIPVRRFNMLRSRMTSAPSHITEGTQRVMLRSIRSKELGEHICFSQVTTVESCLGFIYTL